MTEITDAELDAMEFQCLRYLSSETFMRLIAEVRRLRAAAARLDALENPICLVCGATKQCEENSAACTFTPTPRQLYEANERLQATVDALLREQAGTIR